MVLYTLVAHLQLLNKHQPTLVRVFKLLRPLLRRRLRLLMRVRCFSGWFSDWFSGWFTLGCRFLPKVGCSCGAESALSCLTRGADFLRWLLWD